MTDLVKTNQILCLTLGSFHQLQFKVTSVNAGLIFVHIFAVHLIHIPLFAWAAGRFYCWGIMTSHTTADRPSRLWTRRQRNAFSNKPQLLPAESHCKAQSILVFLFLDALMVTENNINSKSVKQLSRKFKHNCIDFG